MHFSLMAATFPCMRKFLKAFDLNMGATTKMETEIGYGSMSGSYHLKSIDKGDTREPTRLAGQGRPELNHTLTTVAAAVRRNHPSESRSIESDGSDQAIIRKTLQWDVRYERCE